VTTRAANWFAVEAGSVGFIGRTAWHHGIATMAGSIADSEAQQNVQINLFSTRPKRLLRAMKNTQIEPMRCACGVPELGHGL